MNIVAAPITIFKKQDKSLSFRYRIIKPSVHFSPGDPPILKASLVKPNGCGCGGPR